MFYAKYPIVSQITKRGIPIKRTSPVPADVPSGGTMATGVRFRKGVRFKSSATDVPLVSFISVLKLKMSRPCYEPRLESDAKKYRPTWSTQVIAWNF